MSSSRALYIFAMVQLVFSRRVALTLLFAAAFALLVFGVDGQLEHQDLFRSLQDSDAFAPMVYIVRPSSSQPAQRRNDPIYDASFRFDLQSSISGGNACKSASDACDANKITPCQYGSCYNSVCSLNSLLACGKTCDVSGASKGICGDGMTCVSSGNTATGSCKTALEYGCSCDYDKECLNGYCMVGVCQNLRNAGETCTANAQCASAVCDSTTNSCAAYTAGQNCVLKAPNANPCQDGHYCNALLPSNRNEYPRTGTCDPRIPVTGQCTMRDYFNDGCTYGAMCDFGSGVGQANYAAVLGVCRKMLAYSTPSYTSPPIACSTGKMSNWVCPIGYRCWDNTCRSASSISNPSYCDNENACALGQGCYCASAQNSCLGAVADLSSTCQAKLDAMITCLNTNQITTSQWFATTAALQAKDEKVNRVCKTALIDLYCSCKDTAGAYFYSSSTKIDCTTKEYTSLDTVALCKACVKVSNSPSLRNNTLTGLFLLAVAVAVAITI